MQEFATIFNNVSEIFFKNALKAKEVLRQPEFSVAVTDCIICNKNLV